MSDYPTQREDEADEDYELRLAAFQDSQRVVNEWSTLMGSTGNRARIWELLERSHQSEPIADNDAMQLMRRASVRDFGLRLRNDLHRACPDLLALAQREANDRAK